MSNPQAVNNFSAYKFNETYASFMEDISLPLQENFNITHFACSKIFNSGSHLRLSNKFEWTKKYFEKEFYNDDDLYGLDKLPENKTSLRILTGNPTNEHYKILCQEYKIWNCLVIYERIENICYLWFFATSPENNQVIDFYINNIDVLKHFIFFAKEKLSFLLDDNDPQKFICSNLAFKNNSLYSAHNIDNFLQQTKVTKYIGKEKFKKFHLSPQEFKCLKALTEGKTLKEAAQSLQISPRTLESYFNNVKRKGNFFTRSQVISYFYKEILDF